MGGFPETPRIVLGLWINVICTEKHGKQMQPIFIHLPNNRKSEHAMNSILGVSLDMELIEGFFYSI